MTKTPFSKHLFMAGLAMTATAIGAIWYLILGLKLESFVYGTSIAALFLLISGFAVAALKGDNWE